MVFSFCLFWQGFVIIIQLLYVILSFLFEQTLNFMLFKFDQKFPSTLKVM